jgi:hypothetical protein
MQNHTSFSLRIAPVRNSQNLYPTPKNFAFEVTSVSGARIHKQNDTSHVTYNSMCRNFGAEAVVELSESESLEDCDGKKYMKNLAAKKIIAETRK